ncbi:uncharacterized protein LY79DRAFT_380742 [Colletotrichum navitas]|uniref:Uncharacterized protein n=1 Tax=Colletotrichum navitas TaxID=681940 RepID=A0AAD8Q7I1_9PEZI|nr:uncharacterized protein LY79DRAFT_380742 [Colletotrichum navitas]KAK1597300.1 hypothetical protein LY79DRAFT_380742 [Colletotrichum navitas]
MPPSATLLPPHNTYLLTLPTRGLHCTCYLLGQHLPCPRSTQASVLLNPLCQALSPPGEPSKGAHCPSRRRLLHVCQYKQQPLFSPQHALEITIFTLLVRAITLPTLSPALLAQQLSFGPSTTPPSQPPGIGPSSLPVCLLSYTRHAVLVEKYPTANALLLGLERWRPLATYLLAASAPDSNPPALSAGSP